MASGVLSPQARFEGLAELLGERLQGIYRSLAENGDVLFPSDYFADLYTKSRLGQPTVAARVVATVMLLQSHEGLSEHEATDRLERDLAWQAAAGVHAGYEAFHPTLLVGSSAPQALRKPSPRVLPTWRLGAWRTTRPRVLASLLGEPPI
jgi:hypothetical protein